MADGNLIASLVDMGFSRENCEFAVRKTKKSNVQDVLEWMLTHSDNIDEMRIKEESASNSGNGVESTSEGSSEQAKSLVCDDCGKLFQNAEEAEFHAVKSGHANFSESTEEKKPLTEEEKRLKKEQLETLIKQKRKEREEREAREQLEREKVRIKSGKELTEARKRLQDMEMQKMLEQRKRDKMEELKAKEKVRKQIEEDKLRRKEKFSQNEVQPEKEKPATEHIQSSKVYTEARLQIRFPDGETVTQSFGAKEPLSSVRVYLEMNHPNIPTPFQLMTTFPRREFGEEDYTASLDTLNLVPSAVIIVKKSV